MFTPEQTRVVDSERRPFPEYGIFGLAKHIENLTGPEAVIARRILRVWNMVGEARPPESMRQFCTEQFGGVENVATQHIVRVKNKVLETGTLFNSLRSMRPGSVKASDDGVNGFIEESLRRKDVFKDPLSGTPASPWGRIRGNYCITAENVAKFDGQHALIIFDEAHPLKFSREAVIDYLKVVKEVWEKQHAYDPEAVYPFLAWHAMNKSAASVVHGHAQVLMARHEHYAGIQRLKIAAERYQEEFGVNFWPDYVHLHDVLGLMVKRNGVAIMAHVVPFKENEIWMLGTGFDEEFINDTYELLDVYKNRLGVRSFTLSIIHPPIAPTPEDWSTFPVLLALIDRGDPLSPTSDMGAMELRAESVVASSPYDVARVLREHWGESA